MSQIQSQQLPQKMEDLWGRAGSLPAGQRLNSAFDQVKVSSFPDLPRGKVIEIDANASLAEAIQLLGHNSILSAPVRDPGAPADASWMDGYLGIIDFHGIIFWLLEQSEVAKVALIKGAAGSGTVAAGLLGSAGAVVAGATPLGVAGGAALASGLAATGFAAVGPEQNVPEAVGAMGGEFFEALTSSDFYKQAKVQDIAGSFRWAPFLPVKGDDSLLTLLLLLSKYRMKSLPLVEPGEGQISNFITQSSVVHFLSQCSGLSWFDSVGNHSLADLGLPFMKPHQIVKVEEDRPLLEAFQLMREKGVGGVPMTAKRSHKLLGNISACDVQFLLSTPEIFKDYRSVTAINFLDAARTYLRNQGNVNAPLLREPVTCASTDTLTEVISKLDEAKVHRVYAVDSEGNLEGIVTLGDIICTFVVEPPDYFEDFFAGIVPSTSFS